MPAIMRRTPTTEEASSYGYVDFLKDVVRKTVADTTAGFKRPTDFSDEEIMEMAFAGVGGGTKISKGLGKGKFPFGSYKSGELIDSFAKRDWAVKLKTGQIASDTKVVNHPHLVEKLNIDPENVADTGFVIKGKFASWKDLRLSREVEIIKKRYESQGLTYDAFVNQLPDKPQFAYHQWTFRGEGPLAKATVTTRGTSLDEFEEMVADRIRKFAKPMITFKE